MAIKTFNPTPRPEEPDRRGRWINPQDFEKEHGYDYTDDPKFDSRADAGGAVDPSDPPTMLNDPPALMFAVNLSIWNP